jgi:hypothetical protein
VDRMLSDSRANTFYRRFPERWLRIDKLGTMPPPGGFYYHRAMENEMREQVDAYFSYLVRENAPIHQVIDSDFTFLNERTAQWIYKRDDVWGDRFRKVRALPPHGGGMLTMPAVMTATANGVDTSPVVRGVWVLESLLGSAPAPPPPGVEPVAPDLRNARTIREQLIAHRAQAACSKCHERIDPLGFAFENFDELGLWRTHYRDAGVSIEIDAKIEFPQGKAGVGVDDLKQYLLDQEPRVTRNLIQTMVEYSIGRRLEPVDRPAIDELARQSKEDGGGMRDLIYSVVQSSLFQTKWSNLWSRGISWLLPSMTGDGNNDTPRESKGVTFLKLTRLKQKSRQISRGKLEENEAMVQLFKSFGLEIVVGMIFSVLAFLFCRVAYFSWIKKEGKE